jgi:hypothetical protein
MQYFITNKFVENQNNLFSRGSTVQMVCKAEGSPVPKISWRKDAELVTNGRRHKLSPGFEFPNFFPFNDSFKLSV